MLAESSFPKVPLENPLHFCTAGQWVEVQSWWFFLMPISQQTENSNVYGPDLVTSMVITSTSIKRRKITLILPYDSNFYRL